MLTLKQAFEDLYDRMQKQRAETIWTIERIKPMSQKEVEEFQGKAVKKDSILKSLEKELKEREDNLTVVGRLLQKYNGSE